MLLIVYASRISLRETVNFIIVVRALGDVTSSMNVFDSVK